MTDEHEAMDVVGSRAKMAKADLTAEQRDHLERHVAGIGHNQGPALLEHTEEIIEPARHHRLKAELTGIHRRRLFNRLQGLWIRLSCHIRTSVSARLRDLYTSTELCPSAGPVTR